MEEYLLQNNRVQSSRAAAGPPQSPFILHMDAVILSEATQAAGHTEGRKFVKASWRFRGWELDFSCEV